MADLRSLLHDVPFMALTATATVLDVRLMKQLLRCEENDVGVRVYRDSTVRHNLQLSVVPKQGEGTHQLLQLVSAMPGSGIVYTHTRADAVQLADALHRNAVASAPYHGAMDRTLRAQVAQEWCTGARLPCIVQSGLTLARLLSP